MKVLSTILIVTFLSLNSFADLSRDKAKKLTEQSILDTNLARVELSAQNGYCNADGYELGTKEGQFAKKKLESLGYEVTSNENGGYLITWCD
jgi:hypothetical protein